VERQLQILIVEDEKKFASALRAGLAAADYGVRAAATGEEGFFAASREAFDLIILDLMLPGCSGIDFLMTLRGRRIQTPVLALTAKETIEDRVQALDCGADDYLVKPCAFSELLARIRALLRRGCGADALRLTCEDLEMDVATHRVTRGTATLNLTAKEYEVVAYFLRHGRRVVSRETLAREVWNITERATPLDNVIDVTIARLRRKLDDPFAHKLLRTVRGVGYVLG
jgi:DNA-binding response OmpR family regulator